MLVLLALVPQPAGAFAAAIFCFSLNALLLLVPEYHMMDMNIISLVTISLLMVKRCPPLLVPRASQARRISSFIHMLPAYFG